MTCSATRLILIAFAVGVLVATLVGNDLVGWSAAGAAVAIAVLSDRRRSKTGCPAAGEPESVGVAE